MRAAAGKTPSPPVPSPHLPIAPARESPGAVHWAACHRPFRVDIAPGHKTGLALQNPVLTASGTFSWGLEFERHFELQRLGGMVSKGITVEPRAGNKQPRVAQTPAGMLNSIGLQNIGVRAVVDDMAPIWAGWKIPVIANVAGDTVDEFGELSARLDGVPGISALELNISCPNVDVGGMDFGQDPAEAGKATRAAVRNTDLPVIVKLTPNVTDPVAIARACADEGAAAICAINTVLGLGTGRPSAPSHPPPRTRRTERTRHQAGGHAHRLRRRSGSGCSRHRLRRSLHWPRRGRIPHGGRIRRPGRHRHVRQPACTPRCPRRPAAWLAENRVEARRRHRRKRHHRKPVLSWRLMEPGGLPGMPHLFIG